MRTGEWAVFAVLVILGLYMLIFHQDPLPLNHEAIGLGTVHILHDVIAVVLIGVAVFLWRRSTKAARAAGVGRPCT